MWSKSISAHFKFPNMELFKKENGNNDISLSLRKMSLIREAITVLTNTCYVTCWIWIVATHSIANAGLLLSLSIWALFGQKVCWSSFFCKICLSKQGKSSKCTLVMLTYLGMKLFWLISYYTGVLIADSVDGLKWFLLIISLTYAN